MCSYQLMFPGVRSSLVFSHDLELSLLPLVFSLILTVASGLLHLSLPRWFPLFVLVSCVCQSLQCQISTLTQGGGGGHFFRLTCLVMLWGERNTANQYHWPVWGVLAVFPPHWVCPHSQQVCFPSLHCTGSRLLCRELSEASPQLYALSRSKPLRFRNSGTPQRCRLSWACILCLFQV